MRPFIKTGRARFARPPSVISSQSLGEQCAPDSAASGQWVKRPALRKSGNFEGGPRRPGKSDFHSCVAIGKGFPKFRPHFVRPPEEKGTESDLPPCGVSGKRNPEFRLSLVRRGPLLRERSGGPYKRRSGSFGQASHETAARIPHRQSGHKITRTSVRAEKKTTKCSWKVPMSENRDGAPAARRKRGAPGKCTNLRRNCLRGGGASRTKSRRNSVKYALARCTKQSRNPENACTKSRRISAWKSGGGRTK